MNLYDIIFSHYSNHNTLNNRDVINILIASNEMEIIFIIKTKLSYFMKKYFDSENLDIDANKISKGNDTLRKYLILLARGDTFMKKKGYLEYFDTTTPKKHKIPKESIN